MCRFERGQWGAVTLRSTTSYATSFKTKPTSCTTSRCAPRLCVVSVTHTPTPSLPLSPFLPLSPSLPLSPPSLPSSAHVRAIAGHFPGRHRRPFGFFVRCPCQSPHSTSPPPLRPRLRVSGVVRPAVTARCQRHTAIRFVCGCTFPCGCVLTCVCVCVSACATFQVFLAQLPGWRTHQCRRRSQWTPATACSSSHSSSESSRTPRCCSCWAGSCWSVRSRCRRRS